MSLSTVLLTHSFTCQNASAGPQAMQLHLLPGQAGWACSCESSHGHRADLVANLPGKGLQVLGEYDTYENDYRTERGIPNGYGDLVRKARRYGLRIVSAALPGTC